MKKKIFLYTDTPLFGGAEKQTLLLAQNLDRQKFNVQLVCGAYSSLDNWVKEWVNEGFIVHRIKARNKHCLSNYFELLKLIRYEKPALLHVQIWNPMAGKYAILAGKKTKTPITLTEHDPFKLNSFKKIIKRFLLKPAQKIVTVSKANQALMTQEYPEIKDRIETIYNGIDLHKIELERKKFTNDKKNGDFVFMAAGTLHDRKGFDVLIKAMAQMPKHVRLMIAGDGPEKENLENVTFSLELTDRVKLLGWKNNITELMLNADAFVLPSRKEAFGLVLIEAMACGKPIVATKVGGIPEIVISECGFLCEANNVDALVEAMQKCLKEKGNIKAENCIKQAQQFSDHTMGVKTAELYQEIL